MMQPMKFIPDQLFSQAQQFGNQRAFLYPVGKTGTWKDLTWREYLAQVCKLAGWFKQQGISKGDKIAIISANRPEWFISDLAILSVGAVSVPVYPTLTEKDVKYILEHAECKIAMVDDAERAKVLQNVALRNIVLFDQSIVKSGENCSALDDILKSNTSSITAPTPVSDEDLATIVYTSGTTGLPKGAMHTHGNFRYAMTAVADAIGKPESGRDTFFSFLPLSHVAERVLVEMGSLYTGAEVAFARSIKTVSEDLVHCRPTLLLCVPRLWEKIFEKIEAGLLSASPTKRAVFDFAKWLGSCRIDGKEIHKKRGSYLRAQLSDRLVGAALRRRLGMDRCRQVVTGSAPTRGDVMEFFASFGLCIREVYGLTENLCLGVRHEIDHMVIGSCGKSFAGGEVRIANDGEIQFKAPWIFKGYYKNEEATREAFSSDGWFATGDLGQIDAKGNVAIVGRKKELLKTSGGKYVAPVPIEDRIKAQPLVTDAMVVGDGKKFCVATIALDLEVLGSASPQSKKDELVAMLESINSELASFESIKRLGVLKSAFSEEDGTLTPSMKLKRNVAMKKYEGFIDRVYNANETIVFE